MGSMLTGLGLWPGWPHGDPSVRWLRLRSRVRVWSADLGPWRAVCLQELCFRGAHLALGRTLCWAFLPAGRRMSSCPGHLPPARAYHSDRVTSMNLWPWLWSWFGMGEVSLGNTLTRPPAPLLPVWPWGLQPGSSLPSPPQGPPGRNVALTLGRAGEADNGPLHLHPA